MGAITTHVLDTARGRPAIGVPVVLEQREAGREVWKPVGRGETDPDGRLRDLMPDNVRLEPGQYRLIFDTAKYFDTQSVRGFYPSVVIIFEAADGEAHYHVPLLLGRFGYTTYRGS